MKNLTGLLFALALLAFIACDSDPHSYVEVKTDYGVMKVKLYNSTPQHRDNFIKLAEDGYYNDLLFHRIIEGFMIQGGDPDSKGAAQGQRLGMGGPGYQIPAEIGSPHLKGTIAAARNNNPEKMSSGSQFYIVQGTPQTDKALDQVAQAKGITYDEEQRNKYKELGGTPQLDGDYTVFGEVVEGMDVIDKIAALPTDQSNRPIEDVPMQVRVLKK